MLKRLLFLSLLFCSTIAYATDTPASEASIKQLLDVMQAHKLLDSVMGQMDSYMQQAMTAATQGQPVSPDVQQTYDKTRGELVKIYKEELSWDKLEPVYLRTYQKSLSQSEVDGMIAFYKTPAGQAVINKMPLIMQNMMGELQTMLGPIMSRIQRMGQEMAAQVAAEKAKKKSGG